MGFPVFLYPSQFRVVVPKLGTVADLCSALTKLSGVPAENVSFEMPGFLFTF